MATTRSTLLIVVLIIIFIRSSSCEGWFFNSVRKEYWVSSVLSTIRMTSNSVVDVEEEILFGFFGSFGRVERAICDKNLPLGVSNFVVKDLVVSSNYSNVEKVDSSLTNENSCFSINAFLKERTPEEKETYIKFTFKYSMKGPLAGKDNNFTFGWNMKFKKGHVNKATFRVEYPLDFYQVNNMNNQISRHKDIGNGMVRIEKHFINVSPKTDMQLDLQGIVKSSTVELVPPSDPTLVIIVTLGVLLIIPTIAFFSNRKQKAEGTSTDSTNDSTANSYDYYSDGGASCGSCGCDAD